MPAFKSAFAEALASREDRVLKNAAVRLAQEYIYAHQPAEFDVLGERRAGGHRPRLRRIPHLQSFLDHTRCVALYNPGKMVDRLACLERHAAQVEPTRPARRVGAHDAGARRRRRRAVRPGRRLRAAGLRLLAAHQRPDAPAHAGDAHVRVQGADRLRRLRRAASRRAARRCTPWRGSAATTKALLARDRLYTALALIGDKRYDAARSELALARASGADTSETLEAEAKIDASTGHPDRAIPQFRKALAEEQQELPPEHPDVIDAEARAGQGAARSPRSRRGARRPRRGPRGGHARADRSHHARRRRLRRRARHLGHGTGGSSSRAGSGASRARGVRGERRENPGHGGRARCDRGMAGAGGQVAMFTSLPCR